MAGLVDAHEGEVARGLDLTILLLATGNGEVIELGLVERLLSGPLEGLSPGLVAKPVADEIGITSIDEDGNLLENFRHEAVERLHPVALEEEVTVDIEVAAVVARDLGAKSVHNLLLVEVVADPAQRAVAQVAAILALAADIIDILASSLIWSNEGVVTVDGCRNATPDTTTVVAVLDETLASGKSIVHALALRLVQDGRVTTLTTGHGAVMLILSVSIGQTVADQDGLEVDVAVLVGQNLRSEDGDIVTSIGLAGDVEVLMGILGELVEEESEERIDILASSDGVADGAAGV